MIPQQTLDFVKNIIYVSPDEYERFCLNWPTNQTVWEYLGHLSIESLGSRDKPFSPLSRFCDAYLSIKDQSWPSVNSIEDFYNLPERIRTECKLQHKFHPELWFDKNVEFDQWQPSGEDSYPLLDIIRAHYIINKNYDLIDKKRVLDFPCGWGWLAFWMQKFRFDFITLADVRLTNLSLVKKLMLLLEIPAEKFFLVQTDLHDFNANTEICKKHDTLFFCGILYHLHDHFDVLRSITDSGIKNIIIETREHPSYIKSQEPLIWWKSETNELNDKGWVRDQKDMLVGWPNTCWIDITMDMLGYSKSRPADYFFLDFDHLRSVHVFTKKQ